MKPFKFLTPNHNDYIPTPQEIRNSPWLRVVFRQGWNAGSRVDANPPPEYQVSPRTLNVWYEGFNYPRHKIGPNHPMYNFNGTR